MRAARAQDPEPVEISKDKARLAASLFGDDSAPSRPANRRTPQKQVFHLSTLMILSQELSRMRRSHGRRSLSGLSSVPHVPVSRQFGCL